MRPLNKLFGNEEEESPTSDQRLSVVRNSTAAKYYREGEVYFRQGNYAKAVEALRQGITIEPVFSAYVNLGNILKELGDFAEAATAYEQALEINRSAWKVYTELASTYISSYRWDEALAFLTETLKRHQNADLYFNLGCVYSAKQMYDQAIEAQHQALIHNPNDVDALYNLGIDLFNKYLLEYDISLLKEAIAMLERCLAVDPNQSDAQADLERLRRVQTTTSTHSMEVPRTKILIHRSDKEFEVGDIIPLREGYYQCQIEDIKRGGMGVVYIAHHLETHTLKAIKTFKGQAAEDRPALKRFAREAETWIRLDGHPNIVAAEYVEWIDNRLYILMDYIDGVNLRERMQQEALTLPKILDFSIQFCTGMDFAYKRLGIIHRDIKPENILVTKNDVIKITDFGLAKAIIFENTSEKVETGRQISPADFSLTHTGDAAGTLPYMPPEQFSNFKNVGITADVYAFGVTLYEMLVGQWPFSIQSMKKCIHLHQEPPPLRQFDPKLPCELEALVLRCLHKSPQARPADFEVLRTELLALFYTITGDHYVTLHDRGGEYRHERVMGFSNLMETGNSLHNLQRYEEAIAYFEKAAKLNPNKALPFSALVKCYQGLGRPGEAIKYCEQALMVEPDNSRLWNVKGRLYLEILDYERALECLNHALELNPHKSAALVDKAVCLDKLGRYNEALICCDQVPKTDSNIVAALNVKGGILWSLNQYEEALTHLNQALTIEPDNTSIRLNKRRYELDLAEIRKNTSQKYKEWLNHGLALLRSEAYQSALECFEQALKFDETRAEAWIYKADALSELGEAQAAIAGYKKALARDESSFEAWFGLGNCLFDQQAYKDALACFERAVQLRLGDEQVFISQGSCLANLGCFREALACFDQALAIAPQDETVQAYRTACQAYLDREHKE